MPLFHFVRTHFVIKFVMLNSLSNDERISQSSKRDYFGSSFSLKEGILLIL